MKYIQAFGILSMLFFFNGANSQGKLLNPDDATFKEQAPAAFKVLLETSKGNIIMEVKRAWSPNGADRFYNLVRNSFYNNAAVFRIRAGTWAQFGIAGDPGVAQVWRERMIPDDPLVESNLRGTVDYAFKVPNGRTTQVFINLKDNHATHDTVPFVPFAKVIQGMDVADALYAGYGESSGGGIRAGKQDAVFNGGNKYLKEHFPLLDYITRMSILKP